MTFEFTIIVVGEGETQKEAWEDAKQSAEQIVADDSYTSAEEIED
jgi:hypothetical protein